MPATQTQHGSLDDQLKPVQLIAAITFLLATVASAMGWVVSPQHFYSAWLTAFFYWLGISLGCLAWIMVHGMTGGRWGLLIRQILKCSAQTMPLMIVLFAPIWLNVAQIYEWADPESVQHHPELLRKSGYLNVAGFQIRAVAYMALWVGLTWLLSRMSSRLETNQDPELTYNWQRSCGMMFILYSFSMTLAAVDWMMSLEPEWYSTMYGLIHISGQGVSGMAFAIVVLCLLQHVDPWASATTPEKTNDLGNLLLAAVMFWAYCTYFQYLVIWTGNLPEENVWYLRRNKNGWQLVIIVLLSLEFILPFLLLLIRQQKRRLADLARIAWCLLVMRYFELDWLAVPGFPHGRTGLSFHWIDLAAFAATGAAWIVLFCRQLANSSPTVVTESNEGGR
jgi:hypothetical protein